MDLSTTNLVASNILCSLPQANPYQSYSGLSFTTGPCGIRNMLLLLYLPMYVPPALAQSPSSPRQSTTVDQLIPPITNNSRFTPTNWTRHIGGQNFTWCCTKALADSLTIDENNTLAFTESAPVINLDLNALQRATDAGQFPCGATYSGEDPYGAPEVTVSYTWLVNTCPGWQLSTGDNLNGWLQPLSGFLLPAVVFCLSVPRRRKFHVPRDFFVSELGGFKSKSLRLHSWSAGTSTPPVHVPLAGVFLKKANQPF